MKRHAALVAATLVGVVFGVGSPAGQAARDTAAKPATPPAAAGLSAKPFSRLFTQQIRQAEAALQLKTMELNLTKPNSARRFLCGGTIVVAPDAAIDPRFEVPLRDTKTQFSMRSASPPTCR